MKKVALITGGSSGIGSEIAVELATDGFVSIINYNKNLKGAEQTLKWIKSTGGEAIIEQADISSETSVKNMVDNIIKRYGKLDVVVNNAGVFKFEFLEDITKNSFDNHFNTNVWGAIAVIKETVNYMPKGSSIINISTIRSVNSEPSELLYASSKSALDSITRTLAKELGAKGIRLNTVAPGVVDTEGHSNISGMNNEYLQKTINQTPLNRLGKTADIARVVSFLASNKSDWINGERINVAGGLL